MEEETFEDKAEADSFIECMIKSAARSGYSIKVKEPRRVPCIQQNTGTVKFKWLVEFSGITKIYAILLCRDAPN
ncbi:hypothetical protein GALL_217230 [mine drainage metagenome]|uniref:Uncharacterized protein n=1 Tax=mine drainage metagenome TaxID=410659 RepID=A0A1J5RW51_9ZZZZ